MTFKVAIIHYWLITYRGGEKVLEEFCKIFPDADIYTHVYCPDALPENIKRHSIFTTFIQKLPKAAQNYQRYLPLMPLALEQLDLRKYDLVISLESGPAKGIVVTPDTLHICYCQTPMRYAWDMYHSYYSHAGKLTKRLMPLIMHYMRLWDFASAARVDHFLANSHNVAKRVQKHYRRSATVIYPPVHTQAFTVHDRQDDYYLMVGQLVPYKRIDLAIQAFNQLQKPLIIIGEGEQFTALQKMAGPTIQLLGHQPFEVIQSHYARCKAMIFPADEDFGIVPVEAMASGRPVIAYRKGGALETVIDNITGLFFDEQTPESLTQAVLKFETIYQQFNPEKIQFHAQQFDAAVFRQQIKQFVETAMENHFDRVSTISSTPIHDQ
jgi:glycosyltransferase involved in cell wall biosynthesis